MNQCCTCRYFYSILPPHDVGECSDPAKRIRHAQTHESANEAPAVHESLVCNNWCSKYSNATKEAA
jgi:hypothetical protein